MDLEIYLHNKNQSKLNHSLQRVIFLYCHNHEIYYTFRNTVTMFKNKIFHDYDNFFSRRQILKVLEGKSFT